MAPMVERAEADRIGADQRPADSLAADQPAPAGRAGPAPVAFSASPVRVAQVMAGAPVGGAESFYLRLLQALAGAPGVTQRAFVRHTPQREAQLQCAQLPASFCRFGGALDFPGRWQYRRQLQQFAPDVVLTWMSRAAAHTPAGAYTLVNRLGHYYNLKYYRQADYWIGITQGICDHLVRGGAPASRVVHIANFADETPVAAVPRAALDTPAGVPLLLAAGRLHTNKGFDVLLRALVQLPQAWLWLAGSGPEAEALQRLARELGVAARVRFLGWRGDVTALMRSADVFVCPSRHEGLGSIVLESWAHGCALVATRSQGPAELIRHERDGLLVDIDDSAGLARTVSTLLDSAGLRQQLAQAGRQRYQREFSRARISADYREFFSAVRPRR